jgi:hypothetical protein
MFLFKAQAQCDTEGCTASCEVSIKLRAEAIPVMPIRTFEIVEYPALWAFKDFKASCPDCTAKAIKKE